MVIHASASVIRWLESNAADSAAPLPAMEAVAALPELSRIPGDTAMFVGRSDELAQLERVLHGSGRAAVVTVHGLGGVGKSTLAAHFAHLNAHKFGVRWWITADSPVAISAGLAELAISLVPDTAGLPAEQRSELATRWLATHDGWLLILDNIASAKHTAALLERVRTGTVLMTSRQATGWHAIATTVNLDVLAEEHAVELVTKILRAHNSQAHLEQAAELCRLLGGLPLAIEQAGAYMAETSTSPLEYMNLLDRYPATMYDEIAENGDTQRTVARIWRLTLDNLADTPLAGRLLRTLAWYAPDDIPADLLSGLAEEPLLRKALGRLAAYSMITLNTDTIRVHRLVQAVTRTPDRADPHRQPEDVAHARATAADRLAKAVADAHHDAPADWPIFQANLPHAMALLDHSDELDADTTSHCALANRFSLHALCQGDTAAAMALATRAMNSSERLYGRDHPNTLASRNNLAYVYESVGDLSSAIPLHEATLADSVRVLGTDHQNTLAFRSNLAGAYESAGDLGRAIPLYEQTLTACLRALGADHPHTVTACNNLAYAYRSIGDLERAIPLFTATLEAAERVLGADHRYTLVARHNLASAYHSIGDLETSILLHEATLADRERILGPEHPDSLNSRMNLACAYRAAGDLGRAVPMYQSALADAERVLGPEHRLTKLIRSNPIRQTHDHN
ncbi:tetratricopeptide repeat protein [Amycolatopsis sp. NPDC052450]|uniref:tetratricopeptide repeat protein n=1 Tax=Amycolatopsis sp. NPDC052450 TaxID=3363937 RepID=UPI0037C97EF6